MSTHLPKATVAYVFHTDQDSDEYHNIDFALQSLGYEEGSITILVDDTYIDEKVRSYLIAKRRPSVRNIRVTEQTNITMYAESNSYLYAGGIWQVRGSAEHEGYMLKSISVTHIELIEVAALPPLEHERVEAAIRIAQNRLRSEPEPYYHEKFHRVLYRYKRVEYEKVELLQCTEVNDETYRERLRRGAAQLPPEQMWKISFRCYPENQSTWIDRHLLVGYYSTGVFSGSYLDQDGHLSFPPDLRSFFLF